jgi:hypothetical protein
MIRKRIIFFIGALSFFPFLSISADSSKEIEWSRSYEECFKKTASLVPKGEGTIKITAHENQYFFVQDAILLPEKILQYGKKQDIGFDVISISGIDPQGNKQIPFLSDGSRKTKFSFDPYTKEKREIILNMREVLTSSSFHFELYFSGNMIPRFFVSKNNIEYVEVDTIERYDLQYIKIQFENQRNAPHEKYLDIEEIRLYSPQKSTYVLQSKRKQEIHIFSDFQCEKEGEFQKMMQSVQQKSVKTRYSLDISTETFTPHFSDNPTYNKDLDDDSIDNENDNCPFHANPSQNDSDGDRIGNVCDINPGKKDPLNKDSDFDGIGNYSDNCPYTYNPKQRDTNADAKGDKCADDDRDGIIGQKDNCPNISNPKQEDKNINGIGDACEFDTDNDTIFDSIDNCRNASNTSQEDTDKDGIGDVCDNCKYFNPQQIDRDGDGEGDVCEEKRRYRRENDTDQDTIINREDNCPKQKNLDQKDTDKDGIGDVCDNCLELQNAKQQDRDKNGTGDMCEDTDQDGIFGFQDNCPYHANEEQQDTDNDGIGDLCEDDDNDAVLAIEDNCPFDANKNQWDVDNDGKGDACDPTDDRILESNGWIVIGILVSIVFIFVGITRKLVQKIQSDL